MTELAVTAVEFQETPGWRSQLDLDGLAAHIGEVHVEESEKVVPVDTGRLKRSLKWELLSGSSGSEAEVEVSANTFYAIFQELGTRLMAAQPYLLPVLVQSTRRALRDWAASRGRKP